MNRNRITILRKKRFIERLQSDTAWNSSFSGKFLARRVPSHQLQILEIPDSKEFHEALLFDTELCLCLPTPPASCRSGDESQCRIFKLHYRRQYFVVWKVNSFFFFPKNGLICIFYKHKKMFCK